MGTAEGQKGPFCIGRRSNGVYDLGKHIGKHVRYGDAKSASIPNCFVLFRFDFDLIHCLRLVTCLLFCRHASPLVCPSIQASRNGPVAAGSHCNGNQPPAYSRPRYGGLRCRPRTRGIASSAPLRPMLQGIRLGWPRPRDGRHRRPAEPPKIGTAARCGSGHPPPATIGRLRVAPRPWQAGKAWR